MHGGKQQLPKNKLNFKIVCVCVCVCVPGSATEESLGGEESYTSMARRQCLNLNTELST